MIAYAWLTVFWLALPSLFPVTLVRSAFGPVVVLRLASIPANQIPDVFSARFAELIRQAVSARPRPRHTKFRGYVSDEGSWWNAVDAPSLLERFLSMPDDSPGRQTAERFLEEQGDPDGTLTQREKHRFAALVAETYFAVWRNVVRSADSRHIYLGGRFTSPPPSSVVQGMRRALQSGETGGRGVK